MAEYDVDLRDYYRILKKRKVIVVLMVVLSGLSSYLFSRLSEPVPLYEAEASIKIEKATSIADFLSGGLFYQGENIATHAFMLTSFSVMEQTAKRLGLIPESVTPDQLRDSDEYLAVIRRLKGMIFAEQESGTNILNIRVVSENRFETATIANAVAEVYQEYNIKEKNRETFETKAFIEKQLARTSGLLKQAEEKLRKFKEKEKLIALDTQTANMLDRMFEVEANYEKTLILKSEVSYQLKVLESGNLFVQSGGTGLVGDSWSTSVENLYSRLRELILERKALLIDFTEKHPEVVAIDEKINNVRDEIKRYLQATYQKLIVQENDLGQELDRLHEESLKLPLKSIELARLQRNVKLQEELDFQLKKRYQEILIKESGKVKEVTVVRPAMVPFRAINIPSKKKIVLSGIVLGLVLGILIAFLTELLDTSIGTIEDVENLLSIPVLGVIPDMDYREDTRKKLSDRELARQVRANTLVTHYNPKALISEAFRSLRTNIQFIGLEKKEKSFLVTSSFVQEGKTFNIVNLALSIAQGGDRVLLVEGDLRKPQVYKYFGLDKSPGLTDFVLGNFHWKDVVNTVTDVMLGDFDIDDILITPGMDNLNIITAGTPPPNPAEILGSKRFKEFIHEAKKEYDIVLIDAPPLLPVADATKIAQMVDGVILIYKVGKIARGIVKRAKQTLDNIHAQVLGIILNNVRPDAGPDYFRYQTHYYYGTPSDKSSQNLKSNQAGKLKPILIRIGMVLLASILAAGIYFRKDIRVMIQQMMVPPQQNPSQPTSQPSSKLPGIGRDSLKPVNTAASQDFQ